MQIAQFVINNKKERGCQRISLIREIRSLKKKKCTDAICVIRNNKKERGSQKISLIRVIRSLYVEERGSQRISLIREIRSLKENGRE